MQGFPGVIQFTVSSLRLASGVVVSLKGFEKKEGADGFTKAELLDIAPAGGAFVHGRQAVIDKGARLTAWVLSDTPVDASVATATRN